MDANALLQYLKDENTLRSGWGMGYVDTSFPIMPSDFLSYAENDIQALSEHGYINALGNAKRAIDCQSDRLLKLFGCYDGKLSFPAKVKKIKEFDIVAPRVLTKINKTRNELEHYYRKPDAATVEDYLDIATLFLAATEHYTSNFLEYVEYTNEEHPEYKSYGEVGITIDGQHSLLSIKVSEGKSSIEFQVPSSDPCYVDIFKWHIKKMEFR